MPKPDTWCQYAAGSAASPLPHPAMRATGIVLRRADTDDIPWITAACGDRELQPLRTRDPIPLLRVRCLGAFVRGAPPQGAGPGQRRDLRHRPGPGKPGPGKRELCVCPRPTQD